MKTVKFAEVVRRAGQPEIHVSWLPPAQDPDLSRALKQHRVMTLHQQLRGARKDFGTIGLDPGNPGQILIFPRPLRRFAGRRVIAIDYDLLPRPATSPRPVTSVRPAAAHRDPAAKPARRPARPPSAATFRPDSAGRPVDRTPPRAKARPAPRAAATRPTRSIPPERLLEVIRRAAADLRAGRAVAAYERLQDVLASAGRT